MCREAVSFGSRLDVIPCYDDGLNGVKSLELDKSRLEKFALFSVQENKRPRSFVFRDTE